MTREVRYMASQDRKAGAGGGDEDFGVQSRPAASGCEVRYGGRGQSELSAGEWYKGS